MFLRFSSFISHKIRPFFPKSFSTIQPLSIEVNQSETLSLSLIMPNKIRKRILISDQFTIESLKEMILFDSPLSLVTIDISTAKKLNKDSKLIEFLEENSSSSGTINITIDGVAYTLKSRNENWSSAFIKETLEKKLKNPESVFYWMKNIGENKVYGTMNSSLAHFVKDLNNSVNKLPENSEIKEKDLENYINKCIQDFSEPVNAKIQQLLDQRNVLDSEIESIQEEKENFEQSMKRRIISYQKLIFVISIVQMISFYYMIFHVDWLGWDIIEPITFSVTQITMLLGIRFFMKYGKKRDLESMQKMFMNCMINKVKARKTFYSQVNKNLVRKVEERDCINRQLDVLRNRKYYDKFYQA